MVGKMSTAGLGGNCLLMAFSAPAPFARTLSLDALERSVQGGLIGEAAEARYFCEGPARGQQKVLDRVDATFHKPTVRGLTEGSPKSMRKMTYR